MSIPKIIHYCWFGGNEKSDIIKKCISSWQKFCPDYQIIEWNEENYNINSSNYVREAYDSKKWAFVTDVVRLEVVSQYGGVYLDTDVELLGNIDYLLENNAFYFFETDRNVNTGMGYGAVAGHKTVIELLKYYDNRSFIVKGKMDMTPCPNGNTEMLKRVLHQFDRNGKTQVVEGCKVYSPGEYNGIMKHYGTATWIEGNKINRVYKDRAYKRILRNPKIFDNIERYFGTGFVLKVYTFCVYDLVENGLFYFIQRFFNKCKRKL